MDKKYVEYYSPMRKKDILPFATTWIYLEYIMLSEIRQMEKAPYNNTCVKYKKVKLIKDSKMMVTRE